MSSPRGSSSRPSALSRPPTVSLREDFDSSSSTHAANLGGGYSLASEFGSSDTGGGGGGSGARSLAEEFGIDLGEEEGEGDHLSRAESPSENHFFDQDPQFANHDDIEPDPFSLAHEFDNDEGRFHDQFEGGQGSGEAAGGMTLGDELTLGDEFGMDHYNGLDENEAEEDFQQTPTRSKGPRRIRIRTASSFRKQQSFSGLSRASPSSSRSSSPPSRLRSASGSSHPDLDDNSESESLAPQRLFSTSSIPSTPSSAPSSMAVPAETLLLPPTFLPLLTADDRSFELEHAAAALVKTMDDTGRQREGMYRELAGMDRELGRLIGEGMRFYNDDESEDSRREMGLLVEDDEDEDEDEDESLQSFDDEDEDRSRTARQHHLPPSSPSHLRNSTSRKSRPPNPFRPHLSRSTPSSPSSNIPSSPPLSATLLPSLLDLTTLTSSLVTSLSSLHDASQITLSSAADAGRRLRALRTTFAQAKAEEDGLERAWADVLDWEERKTQEGAESVGKMVEREMEGFRKGVEEFEERTKAIREQHQRFLVGVA